MKNDWKVLLYGDHYYVLNRGIKSNDFRKSGRGYHYKAGSQSEILRSMLDYVKNVFEQFNTPQMSFDIAYDGKSNFLIEYQALYFGTATFDLCDIYFQNEDGKWIQKLKEMALEEEFAYSIDWYLKK